MTTRGTSLRRFPPYLRPYRSLVVLAAAFLDEPSSALDPESEALIKHALAELPQGRTAPIIAHRLSTIEHADEVVVLDRGTRG